MRFLVTLVDPDEKVDVDVDARDFRAGERAWPKLLGVPVGTSIETMKDAFPSTTSSWLYWHAAKRAGLTDAAFTAFEARVVADQALGGEALPDPTGAASGAGSS